MGNQLQCLAGGFYALQSRISCKIYYKTLDNDLSTHNSLVKCVCSLNRNVKNGISIQYWQLRRNPSSKNDNNNKKKIFRGLHLCVRSLKNSSIQLTLTVMASWACMFFKGEFLQLLMADSCRSKNCFRILSSMFFGSLFEGPRSLLLSYSGILFFFLTYCIKK